MVASDEPRVNGIAAAWPGDEDIGERASDAGAWSVPGAPMPDEAGTVPVCVMFNLS
jgi:hypothetical protein